MDRSSPPKNDVFVYDSSAGLLLAARPGLRRMTRALELLVHSYVGDCLMLCRRDKQEFLSQFPRFRAELEPLLAAADVAIDAYETIETILPRQRKASWRRLPARERYKLRERFMRGSRLFTEFMTEFREIRARALGRAKEGGAGAASAREFLAWAKPILRDPALAAQVFDQNARRLVADLSRPDEAVDSTLSPHRQRERLN